MPTTTSLRAADIIHGEVANCGLDTANLSSVVQNIIDSGVTRTEAARIAELVFAVYYATKEKYALTIQSKNAEVAA